MIPHIKNLSNKINDLQSIRTTGGVTSVQSGFIVKNTEATTIKKYSVVELISGLLNPDTNIGTRAAWGNSPPIINVRKPLTGAVNLAVMVQSAKAGKTGRASNKGVLKATVNISSTDHKFATISNGSDVLISTTEGEFNLLNCTGGTGEQYAYVSLAGGTGGGSVALNEYVEIIEGLKYDTAEAQNDGKYICRLVGSTVPEAFDGEKQDYEIGDSCIFNNRIYIAKEGYTWTGVVAGTPPVVTTPAPNPPNDTDNWEVSEETAVRIWQKGITTTDFREYLPWLTVGKYYPVRYFEGEYYFENSFIYTGEVGKSNFIVDEETLQVYVAVGATFGM